MSMTFFWILAVLIITVGWVMVERDRTKRGITRDWLGNERHNQNGDTTEKELLKREVEELRERIKVLERIATDDGEAKRLSAEIDSLREDK